MRAEHNKLASKNKNSLELSYDVPISIQEFHGSTNSEAEEGFFVEGVAINSTTTDNNHKFLPEELESFAETLTNKPMLLDHKNEVGSIVGRVIKSEFDPTGQNVKFKAKVMDEKVKEMIKDGRLNSVSIGAMTKEIEEGDNGEFIPRGLVGKELSFVAIPADANAKFGIGMALKCALESHSVDEIDLTKLNGEIMEKEEVSESISKEEFSALSEKVDSQANVLSEILGKIDKMASVKESVEEDTQEPVKEEPVEEPKAEPTPVEEPKEEPTEEEADDDSEEVEEMGNYSIVQGYGTLGGGAFSVVRS